MQVLEVADRAAHRPGRRRHSGDSILMTSAPQSASCRTAVGPARTRVRSMTLKRADGPACASWRGSLRPVLPEAKVRHGSLRAVEASPAGDAMRPTPLVGSNAAASIGLLGTTKMDQRANRAESRAEQQCRDETSSILHDKSGYCRGQRATNIAAAVLNTAQ